MNSDEVVSVPLTPLERAVLAAALNSWQPGGIPRSTEEMAVAMGFSSVAELQREAERLEIAVDDGRPLVPRDWARALILLEIGFASETFGNGTDWSIAYPFSDTETIVVLRQLQRKIRSRSTVGRAFGTYRDDEFGY